MNINQKKLFSMLLLVLFIIQIYIPIYAEVYDPNNPNYQSPLISPNVTYNVPTGWKVVSRNFNSMTIHQTGTNTYAWASQPAWVFDGTNYVPYAYSIDNTAKCYIVQTGVISAKIYNNGTAVFYDPNLKNKVAFETWEVWCNGIKATLNPTITWASIQNSTGVYVTRQQTTTNPSGILKIIYSFCIGVPLKHTVMWVSTTSSRITVQVKQVQTTNFDRVKTIDGVITSTKLEKSPIYICGLGSNDCTLIEDQSISYYSPSGTVLTSQCLQNGYIDFTSKRITYTFGDYTLTFGQSLKIDPDTAILNSPTFSPYITNQNGAVYTRTITTYIQIGYSSTLFYTYVGTVEWDVSSIPSGAAIFDVRFDYDGNVNGGQTVNIYDMVSQPSAQPDTPTGNGVIYNDARAGNLYYSSAVFPVASTNQEAILGALAVTDLQSAIRLHPTWFALGFSATYTGATWNSRFYTAAQGGVNPPPTLWVSYVLPVTAVSSTQSSSVTSSCTTVSPSTSSTMSTTIRTTTVTSWLAKTTSVTSSLITSNVIVMVGTTSTTAIFTSNVLVTGIWTETIFSGGNLVTNQYTQILTSFVVTSTVGRSFTATYLWTSYVATCTTWLTQSIQIFATFSGTAYITVPAAGTLTGFETTCTTSTFTNQILTCTTSCSTQTELSLTCTTTCSTRTEISETTTTTCETESSVTTTCTTSCLTNTSVTTTCTSTCSTFTSITTTCTSTCTTSVFTSLTCTSTCTTSVFTSNTCTTTCSTSISTSITCSTTCSTSVSITSTTTCTTTSETQTSITTTCETTCSTFTSVTTSCTTTCSTFVSITITSTTTCSTTISVTTTCTSSCTTETSVTSTRTTTCYTSIETSETYTTYCETDTIINYTSTTTCDTFIFTTLTSTTSCDTFTQLILKVTCTTTCDTSTYVIATTTTTCATISDSTTMTCMSTSFESTTTSTTQTATYFIVSTTITAYITFTSTSAVDTSTATITATSTESSIILTTTITELTSTTGVISGGGGFPWWIIFIGVIVLAVAIMARERRRR